MKKLNISDAIFYVILFLTLIFVTVVAIRNGKLQEDEPVETMNSDVAIGFVTHEISTTRVYIGALPATTFYVERKLEQDGQVIATALYTDTVDLTIVDDIGYVVESWDNVRFSGIAQEYVRVWWEDGTFDSGISWKQYGTYALDGQVCEYIGDGWYKGREVEARFILYFPLMFQE